MHEREERDTLSDEPDKQSHRWRPAEPGPAQIPFDEAIEERLALCRLRGTVQELLRDYLHGVREADAAIRILPGDPTWGAIDVAYGGQHVVRVFPKSARVQVDNRIPDSKPGDYGPKVELIPKGMWRVVVRDEDDLAVLLRCTSDAILNAKGRRVRPLELTATSRQRLGAALRETGTRARIPASLRFAVLMRDNFTCHYCGRSAPEVILHVDHRNPVSKGGGDTMDNLVTACQKCNLGKSDRFTT